MTGATAVRAEDLGYRYRGGAWALRGCSFDVSAGSVTGLVGSNGAGKSTLLSVLAGQLAATDGRATIFSTDAQRTPVSRTLGDRVRLVNQQRPLYPSMSPLQLLEFGRRTNRYWDERLARGWLDAFDVPLQRACRTLSGGQRTLVTLALALGARPALLLLDEPFAELDTVVRADAIGALLSVNATRGTTIMLSTHAIGELGGVVDQVLLLDAGRLLLDGDVDDLVATHRLCTGPVDVAVPYPGTPVHVTTTGRQTIALVRTAGSITSPRIEPTGWRAAPVPIEEIVLGYLRAAAPLDRAARLHSVLGSAEVA